MRLRLRERAMPPPQSHTPALTTAPPVRVSRWQVLTALEPFRIRLNGTDVTNSSQTCPDDALWNCGLVIYWGAKDWFSHPTVNRYSGEVLPLSDDEVRFVLRSASEVSAPATVRVRVDNVNDPPALTSPGNVTFTPSFAGSTVCENSQNGRRLRMDTTIARKYKRTIHK